MNDGKMLQYISTAAPGSDPNRCPVMFDGVWHNNQWPTFTDQSLNMWGVFFPHRLKSNMAFADGHVETKAMSDFTSFMPVIQVRE